MVYSTYVMHIWACFSDYRWCPYNPLPLLIVATVSQLYEYFVNCYCDVIMCNMYNLNTIWTFLTSAQLGLNIAHSTCFKYVFVMAARASLVGLLDLLFLLCAHSIIPSWLFGELTAFCQEPSHAAMRVDNIFVMQDGLVCSNDRLGFYFGCLQFSCMQVYFCIVKCHIPHGNNREQN